MTAPAPSTEDHGRRLAQLGAVFAAGVTLALVTGHLAAMAVVLALIVIVMLHELGHLVTAKRAGMKVTEYFLGFGPRLWSIRRGETEYGIKAIPAGGYVKIVGMHNLEEVDPADEPRTYRQQSYWRRMSVAVAGSTMHFLIAFVLFFVIFVGTGVPTPRPIVGDVAPDSPARDAGFQVGDRLVSVDGVRFTEWRDLVEAIRARPEERIEVGVERDGRPLTIPVTPARIELDGEDVGQIGVVNSAPFERANPVVAVGRSSSELVRTTWESAKALGSFFTPSSLGDYADLLTGREEPPPGEELPEDDNRFLSPVGFGRVASQAADEGVFEVLALLVLINVFVGLFNLVPLLPLDGGHVAIATYEAIRSRLTHRRYFADVSKLMPLTMTVVFVLVALGATSLWLDIVDPIANPFE